MLLMLDVKAAVHLYDKSTWMHNINQVIHGYYCCSTEVNWSIVVYMLISFHFTNPGSYFK